jgi:teichuronic acid biosynthesis glycosyltransferase TuaG
MSLQEPVTVGIPAYNAESFLGRAVASVRAQRWPITEILVVDDGSTDGTVRRAEELGCRVVTQPVNRGEPAARNLLMANCRTDLLAWLDADDEWLPHHLTTVVPAISGRQSCAAAFGLTRNSPSGRRWALPPASEAGPRLLEAAMHRTLVPHNAVVVRVVHVQAVGGYREALRIACDFDLWCRLAPHYDLLGVDRITAVIHEHAMQSSRKGRAYSRTEYTLRRMYLTDARWHAAALSVSTDWLRRTNNKVWRSHLDSAWHSRDLRSRLWHLGQYHGHGRLAEVAIHAARTGLLPLAMLADSIRTLTRSRPAKPQV